LAWRLLSSFPGGARISLEAAFSPKIRSPRQALKFFPESGQNGHMKMATLTIAFLSAKN
jgi:hypothetical protein